MSSVARAVWVASDLTSEATTAKPLPASPARAASMVALSASRLVWLAMSLISFTTSPILSAASARLRTCPFVRSASAAALLAMSADWPTCRLISAIDPDSCSVAAATVCTLLVASSAAVETMVA